MDSDFANKLKEVPFYKGPEKVKTSGEIIRDAKMLLMRPCPLNTRRPETPLEENRWLFSQHGTKDSVHHPPSPSSIGSRHFDPESRPSSGNVRLTPLPSEPKIRLSSDTDSKVVLRPPADPNRFLRRTNSKPRICQPLSGIGADHETLSSFSRKRSESLKDVSDLRLMSLSAHSTDDTTLDEALRRVHSGPKERTRATPMDNKTDIESFPSQRQSAIAEGLRNDYKQNTCDKAALDCVQGQEVTSTLSALVAKRNSTTEEEYELKGKLQKVPLEDCRLPKVKVAAVIPGDLRLHSKTAVDNLGSNMDAESNGNGKVGGESLGSKKPRSIGAVDDGQNADTYFERVIAPVLDEMAAVAQDKNIEKLTELSRCLYQLLKKGCLLGRSCRQRSAILKCIYQLLDINSPQLLLNLARLILALKVSGKNLLNICIMIFAVSRDGQNDDLFLQDNFLDLLVETAHRIGVDHLLSSRDCHQTLVYCLGSLKFLSSNASLVKFLASKSHLNSFAQIFTAVSQASCFSDIESDQTDILVQLTAILRNLANVTGNKQHFLSLGLVEGICGIMVKSNSSQELIYNISGLLSKLTLHANCCEAVSKNQINFVSFLDILAKYKSCEDLVLRVTFILGNLLAKQDNARNHLFNQTNALDMLLSTLKFYFDKDAALSQEKGDLSVEAVLRTQKKMEDVIIKTVRVIANGSINPEIGAMIARSDNCIELLLQVLEQKRLDESEELLLNVMATINNLSFYSLQDSAIVKKRMSLAQALLKFLQVNHMEGLAEATLIFGNLTREKDIRNFLIKNKVDEAMVALLDSGNRELVFSACGVLINLMADEEKRQHLSREGGIAKLIGVLLEFGRSDWQLAGMVCQTLWNFSAKITSAASCFGEEEAQEIADILTEYLDEEFIAENVELDEEMREYFIETWKTEFYPVASDLLRRIEENQSHLEPLAHLS